MPLNTWLAQGMEYQPGIFESDEASEEDCAKSSSPRSCAGPHGRHWRRFWFFGLLCELRGRLSTHTVNIGKLQHGALRPGRVQATEGLRSSPSPTQVVRGHACLMHALMLRHTSGIQCVASANTERTIPAARLQV